jgi:integrase
MMATVRKRKLPSGLIRWQASYVDGAGQRRAKLFDRKSDGEAWLVETKSRFGSRSAYPSQRLPDR